MLEFYSFKTNVRPSTIYIKELDSFESDLIRLDKFIKYGNVNNCIQR